MTIDELKVRLQEIIDRTAEHYDGSTDTEEDHIDADNALLAFIGGIDPEVGVLFRKIKRWYA